MKKHFLIFTLAVIFGTSLLSANDTYFYMAGGQLVPTKETDIQVEMQEEVINIVLEDKYYEVTVDFFFYNHDKTVDLEIGFPFFCVGISGNGEISDFKCWTNDIEEDYTDFPLTKKWADDTQLENAYIRHIKFPPKKITKTKVSYKSTYGREAPSYNIAKYLYGTGSSWKNSIGKMTIRITNNNLYYRPNWVSLPGENSMQRTSENSWEGVYTNVEPKDYTECITIIMGDIFGDDGPRILQKNRFFGCNAQLQKSHLFWYTKPQLRLVRNAIYAFNGYPFKSPDLIELFEKTLTEYGWVGWTADDQKIYPLDNNFSESKLTQTEKDNVKLILEEENSFAKIKSN